MAAQRKRVGRFVIVLIVAAMVGRVARAAQEDVAVVEDTTSGEEEVRNVPVVDETNPELSEWLMKNAESVGSYVGSTDVADMLEGALSNVLGTEHALEGTLAARMEGLVPKGKRGILSSFAAYVITFIPLALLAYASYKAGKMVSLRQYILIANLCNLVSVAAIFAWYLVSADDPVELMVVLNPRLVIFVQMCLAIQFPCFCLLLVTAIMSSTTKKQKMYFIFQFLLYCAIALDYRKRVWKPTILKQIFESQTIFAYMSYLVVFSFMTYLTVRSAKIERNETLVSEVEAVMTNVQKNATDVVLEAVDPTANTNDADKIN
eukprot:CAMPEP_0198332262 /NCGR_PEP_ID=MMETSP1450-20131203/18159_1 /TAXON_ID=753684 ORGANISM="Madagascaria erythrocladiodes, Strain CCMP3234" /NCGR_SAMPLE_ID=MMETSP1450 /ASSEMBLY_ACC=CAM_ASM_001115 /LENGTH=318 /DNA_ID=CAMNT_0044036705 /DNA_START=130 /DNA_END=1086 /DNA_ORIENTATION=-